MTETAPVIPAVETTEPLSAEVASPATVPTETTEVAPATNGETKKDLKAEKRKSSLPFAFGKKEKSPASDEEGEKKEKASPFSKLRQTIKGKGKAEKPAAAPAETEATAEETPAETEAAAPVEAEAAKVEEAPVATEAATEEKPAEAAAAPAVTATA